MHNVVSDLIDRIENPALINAGIIPWACPVPSFGDPKKSTVATLGLNPSNREFVDPNGNELCAREIECLNKVLGRYATRVVFVG